MEATSSTNPAPAPAPLPKLSFNPSNLPVAQLESLKFKANQIVESIISLRATVEGGYQNVMPPWPEILSKYNILLSQTLNFSNSLSATIGSSQASTSRLPIGAQQLPQTSQYEKIALHLNGAVSEKEADEIALLVRTFQLPQILQSENNAVRRLSERMATRGSMGVMGSVPPPVNAFGSARKPEYEDVLRECAEIKDQHDRMVDRAVKAVTMLRDKYDWKQRVEVEVEEPEELDWDPRLGMLPPPDEDMQGGSPSSDEDSPGPDGDEGDSDEDEVEDELTRNAGAHDASQDGMDAQFQMPTPVPDSSMDVS
ncbi:hypothetical protein ONZ45_g4318 [Pleurotus djamor]|nr:hypothetical protein ONZ45_g4318 [Pleurotus djamor]